MLNVVGGQWTGIGVQKKAEFEVFLVGKRKPRRSLEGDFLSGEVGPETAEFSSTEKWCRSLDDRGFAGKIGWADNEFGVFGVGTGGL